MPLRPDNVIQTTSGSYHGTTGNATVAATTAGNTVILVATVADQTNAAVILTIPAGFTRDSANPATGAEFVKVYVWRKSNVGAGETTYAVDTSGAGSAVPVTWVALEVENVDPDISVDVAGGYNFDNFGSTTATTGTTLTVGASATFDGMAVVVHSGLNTAGATVPTWSAHVNTNNALYTPEELVDVGQAGTGRALGTSVSLRFVESPAVMIVAATASVSVLWGSTVVVFRATGAKSVVSANIVFGAEIGTATALGGTASTSPFDTATGTPAITSTNPRSGTYALQLAASAAIENVTWTAPGSLDLYGPSQRCVVQRFCLRFNTALPGGNVALASWEVVTLANGCVLSYDSASQKLQMKVGTGTAVLSNTTVAANTWIGIDVGYDTRTTTHLMHWSIDYDVADATSSVPQTDATKTAMTADLVTAIRFGWTASSTADISIDDVVVTKVLANYPLGDYQVLGLKVDPSVTPTISGTSANFGVFTNNTTIGAWDATNARAAIDEIPPTIGASADGICQVTLATNDYVIVPMDTLTLAPTYCTARGVRWYFCMWAASTSAATIVLRVTDQPWVDEAPSTDYYTVFSGDPDANTTAPVWVCGMHRGPRGGVNTDTRPVWDQTRLNGLLFRMGMSGDATPDIGIHTVLAEVALQPPVTYRIMDGEDGAFYVDQKQDPVTSAIVSWVCTTPAGTRGATLDWVIDGVAGSEYVEPGTTYEKVVGASTIENVTYVGMTPDPTDP